MDFAGNLHIAWAYNKLMMSTPLIEVLQISKRFEEVLAVDKISFAVQEGELFGFLGPNGAGKTTTISMLTGLARPDTGEIKIAGLDCSKNSKRAQHLIGVVPDESNLYGELSGYDNLCFYASLYGMRKPAREKRARELLEAFDLADAAGRKFAGYSKGMKRKLTIAAGILHNPPVLFLDEPTTGIDVSSARQIRQLIADLHSKGTTIFLTTHYIEEAERLCQRIGFIVKGQIVKTETVSNLLQPVQGKHILLLSMAYARDDLCKMLASSFAGVTFTSFPGNQVRAESVSPLSLSALVHAIESQGVEVLEARRVRSSLEEVFVQVTGIEINQMKKEKEKGGGNS